MRSAFSRDTLPLNRLDAPDTEPIVLHKADAVAGFGATLKALTSSSQGEDRLLERNTEG